MKTNGFCMAPDDLDGQEEISCDTNIQTAKDSDIEPRIGIQIVLMSETGKMRSLWLPEPPVGKYRFEETDDDKISESIYIEAKNGKWYACCNSPAYFRNQVGEICFGIEIIDNCIFSVESISNKCVVYAESVNSFSGIFRNYQVDRFSEIYIGRANSNDIVYPNILISQTHAILKRNSKSWSIQDCNSTNGVFVNGRKVTEAELKTGDRIYIMGLQIIIGIGFISVNDSNDRIRILSDKLQAVKSTENLGLPEPDYVSQDNESLFNRLPRKRRALELKPIVIDAPPMSLNSNSIPLLLRMGGPMVMSSASLLAGNITSMLSSVLFPVLTQKFTEKQRKEYEEKRNTKYNQYLAQKSAEIRQELAFEQSVLSENYPELAQVLSYSDSEERLWERRKIDDDFMTLRIGSGSYPLLARCEFPPRGFDIDEDPLMDKMYQMVESPVFLNNAPIMTSFIEDYVCGVLGARRLELSFVQRLIMQLSILHSYDEVKIVLLAEDGELGCLEFVKYIPHIWNDQRDFRFLATSTSDAYQISEYLKQEIANDLEKQRELKDILKTRPYYMVFALSKRIFDSMEVLKDVMQADKNCGVSVLAVFDDLPKECVKIFNLKSSGEHSVVHLKQIEKTDKTFRMDNYDPVAANRSMKKISNTSLRVVTQAYSLPKTVTFLEMYGVGRIEHLNPLKRWQENNPVKSLAAPVGVATDGSLFTLDLHEKFQGPHGLVAGMTGSGKSEFIITYILSMAINYHPDEVAFILIDYKGGGLAGAFDDEARGIHLPHLVGTITNLDGTAIQRSLMSIQSELMRRQRIFNEAKSRTGEGTMDIYTYQKLYRSKKVKEPLPHLFIISDEFAELKKQEPEFMEKLISAARIGRSLGVHLILATQKPSGVVDDQIWSNTKFRVCLRVQDRGDSIEMLKRPEAAELKDTGRFYLQVGYNEFFALGQSAWCGAQYEPHDEVIIQRDDELQIVDSVGQAMIKARPEIAKVGTGRKQIVEIVKYLSDLAEQEHIISRQMWKEPLSTQIGLEELREKYNVQKTEYVQALLGIVDDPSHQRQFPLSFDVQHSRNLLITGESGSGKTTMLQTILFDLVMHYSSQKLQFYILDFSSRNLRLFGKVPHCGAAITDENEETIMQVLMLIRDVIEERRRLFAAADVSSYDAYLEITDLPLVLLVIDNVVRIEEMKSRSELYSMLEDFMSNGVGYGIKVIFTVSQINTCPMRLRRNAGSKIALRARDRYVYSDILDRRCTYEPVDTPGRGMCVIDDGCYEFQTALAANISSEKERSKVIRQDLDAIAQRVENNIVARRLEHLDEDQTYEDFCRYFEPGRIPLGFHLEDLQKVAIPLQQLNSMSLYFGNIQCVSPILSNLLYAIRREQAELILIKRSKNSMFDIGSSLLAEVTSGANTTILSCTHNGVQQMLDMLGAEVQKRKVNRNAYCEEHGISDWSDPEAVKQWRRFVRSRCAPIFVFFESLLDVAVQIDVKTAGILGAYFQQCLGYNIYFSASFYPDDVERMQRAKYPNGEENASEDEGSEEYIRRKELRHIWDGIRQTYNPDRFALLFGGQFDKQQVATLPAKWQSVKNPCSAKNIDKLLMYYHGNVYSLSMPCQKPLAAVEDSDEVDIIGNVGGK